MKYTEWEISYLVTCEKDLGIIINYKLNIGEHFDMSTKKANAGLGLNQQNDVFQITG